MLSRTLDRIAWRSRFRRLYAVNCRRAVFPCLACLFMLGGVMAPAAANDQSPGAQQDASQERPPWRVPASSDMGQAAFTAQLIDTARAVTAAANARARKRADGAADKPTAFERIQNADWVFGPRTIELDHHAVLELPEGYAYLAPEDLAALRAQYGAGGQQRVSPGLLADADISTLVRLFTMKIGHVRINTTRLDPARLKGAMSLALSSPGPTGELSVHAINWLRWPDWDAATWRLDWAFADRTLRDGQLSKRYEVDSLLLGRRAVVAMQGRFNGGKIGQARAVLAQDVIDHVMAGVHFAPGYSYADVTSSDPRADSVLTDFIAPDYRPPTAAETADGGPPTARTGTRDTQAAGSNSDRSAVPAGSVTAQTSSRDTTDDTAGTTTVRTDPTRQSADPTGRDSMSHGFMTMLADGWWGIGLLAIVFIIAIWLAGRILQRP